MKAKISIISPVHIGTGNVKLSFEYNKHGNVIYNYDLQKLFSYIPEKKLLDAKFLESLCHLKNGISTRDTMNNFLRMDIDYEKISPQYQLRADFTEIQKKNIAEQLKSLNKPFIPGSSLKGAVMTAIYYDFISEHLKSFCQYIKKSVKNKNNINIFNFLRYYYHYPKDLIYFQKLFANCFMFTDVFFDKMVLVHAIRNKVDDDDEKNLAINDYECIDVKQECESNIIIINDSRKEALKHLYKHKQYYKDFVKYIDIKKIIEVCQNYFKDNISEEIEMEKDNSYYVKEGLDKKLNEFYEDTVSNGFYMRIGANTNYFFKTVSYLIKKNDSNLYNKYFYKVFSPKDKPKDEPKGKNKAYPLPDKMPATRTIYVDDLYAYYPGVIKIEFYKEN